MIERNVSQFDADVRANAGYLYTTNARKSSVLANRRLTDVTQAMVDLRGRRVIDVGCGDGTYSRSSLPRVARRDGGSRRLGRSRRVGEPHLRRPGLRFDTCSVYDLPYESGSFDVAVVRGLLHHLDDAPRALARIGTLAREVFVIEPNGYNPTLEVDRALLALSPRAWGEVVRAGVSCGAGSASSAARSSASSTRASCRSSVRIGWRRG